MTAAGSGATPADRSARTVLVAGGAGQVGEGIVRQLLQRGNGVVVPSRSQTRLEQLRGLLDAPGDRLVTLVGDIGSAPGAGQLRRRVEAEVGDLDAVIASIGGWWSGPPMVEVAMDDWHRLIDANLTAHVVAARTFLPVVAGRRGASYTLINGSGATQPVAGSGPVNVAAAGQLMLKDVLALEHTDDPVRINTLLIGTPVRTRSRPDGPAGWVDADDVGSAVADLVEDGPDGATVPLPR